MQRALDEIGEETAGILQRAHETADEIAARSRAQAEGRIQRAEREADMLRQQADSYSEQLVVDTRILWRSASGCSRTSVSSRTRCSPRLRTRASA